MELTMRDHCKIWRKVEKEFYESLLINNSMKDFLGTTSMMEQASLKLNNNFMRVNSNKAFIMGLEY